MLGKKNGIDRDIKVFRPIDGRPDLIVVQLQDGRQAVFGDGRPLNTEEFLRIKGGTVESTTPRLEFNDDEQTELDQANARLKRASELVDQLYAEGNRLSAEMKQAPNSVDPYGYRKLTDQERDIINGIQVAAHELNGRISEAGELEKSALTERNAIERRVIAAARERQFPVQLHSPPLSADERLSALEKSK